MITQLTQTLVLLTVTLLIWAGHFFPWHVIPVIVEPNGKRELKRLFAYIYGVGCIWLGALGFAEINRAIGLPPVITIGELTAIIIAAFVGAVLPRIVKRIRDWQVSLSEKSHDPAK